LGPLWVHVHLHFPNSRPMSKWRFPLAALYSLAVMGAIAHLIWNAGSQSPSVLGEAVYAAGRLFLVLCLGIVIALLLQSYVRPGAMRVRQQIRLVCLGGVLAFLLFVTLAILPIALIQRPLVPVQWGFVFLSLIPIFYGYAIVRHRLIKIEPFLNRGAADVLVFALLVGLFLGLSALVSHFLSPDLMNQPAVILVIVLLMAISFGALRKRLQAMVDWVFYGGWYDLDSAVDNITSGLQQLRQVSVLDEIVSSRLKDTLRLDTTFLLLAESDGSILLPPHMARPPRDATHKDGEAPPALLSSRGGLSQLLRHQSDPVLADDLLRSEMEFSKGELAFIQSLRDCLLVPVSGRTNLLGLIVLGQRYGGEAIDPEDYGILRIVARHVGVALDNILLLAELQGRAAEVEQLHREILRAREEERKRLARELHDGVIQALVGLNYELAHIEDHGAPHLKEEIRQIVGNLRRVCRELRPPMLDNLGLVSAVRYLTREFSTTETNPLNIVLKTDSDEDEWVPEEIALCLYRVLHEALINVQKHAGAKKVQVELATQRDEISLEVKDDGQGFAVPHHLGDLLADSHFGLVGLRERLDLVRGKLEITSAPGEGTRLRVQVPIDHRGDRNPPEKG
ncbi:MAG: histidine kinase, partial [Anaerolineales bacterium]